MDAVNAPAGDAFGGTVPRATPSGGNTVPMPRDEEAAGRINERCINTQTKTIYIKRNKELRKFVRIRSRHKAGSDGGKKKCSRDTELHGKGFDTLSNPKPRT